MAVKRATTAKLGLGEDTIMRATPRKQPDGTYWLDWSYQPLDGSKRLRARSKGATVGEARRRARGKVAEIQATGSSGSWKPGDDIVVYVEKVSLPAIEKAGLSPLTRTSYETAVNLLVGDCARERHQHSLKRHTIASATRYRSLEALLTEIGAQHGRATAKQCRTVLTKYVLTRLIRDELIQGNPIAGVSLDELIGMKKGARARGGKALTKPQYDAVLDYLLHLDPAEGVVKRQGRWSLEHLIAKRANAIDQALLQATTGLRSTEANLLTWGHLETDDSGAMSIRVTADIAKGGTPRVALVLDDRVAERIMNRRAGASKKHYVIGAPSDPSTPWDRDNRNKVAQALYLEIREQLDIDILEIERSHVWRTTLHTLYGGSVAAAVLDTQFGNSEKIRAKHYTDASDLSSLRAASLK